MTGQTIYCSYCGTKYKADFGSGWVERATHSRVCSKECHDAMSLLYARALLGKTSEADE